METALISGFIVTRRLPVSHIMTHSYQGTGQKLSHKKKWKELLNLNVNECFSLCCFLTVILVALLSALTQSTRSCWSLACRKNFLIPALMTNRWKQQDKCITTTWLYGYSQVIVYQKTIFYKKWQRYDVKYFSRSESKLSRAVLKSYQQQPADNVHFCCLSLQPGNKSNYSSIFSLIQPRLPACVKC